MRFPGLRSGGVGVRVRPDASSGNLARRVSSAPFRLEAAQDPTGGRWSVYTLSFRGLGHFPDTAMA